MRTYSRAFSSSCAHVHISHCTCLGCIISSKAQPTCFASRSLDEAEGFKRMILKAQARREELNNETLREVRAWVHES